MTISKTTHRLTMHDFEHATVKVTATTSAFPITAISFGMSGGLVLETMSCPASELADWLREKADEIDGANVAMYDHGCETGVGGMTLKADHSDLPPAAAPTPVTGLAPDEEPRFVGVLADLWQTEHDEDKPTAMGTRFRHSDAGKCSRALGFKAAGFPASDPMDLTGVWNVRLGSMLHDLWQKALAMSYPDAEIELRARIEDFDGSCHIDAVVEHEGRRICIELKTIGGFGFKASVGKAGRSRPAEGPKTEHLLQAALNGLAIDADEVVVAYLAKECISVKAGAGMDDLARFAAEWTFPRDQYEPLAKLEVERVTGILGLVDEGTLPARKVLDLPKSSEIVDPSTGRWEQTDRDGKVVDTGSYWGCDYCSFQTLCISTESGRIPVESVVALRAVS